MSVSPSPMHCCSQLLCCCWGSPLGPSACLAGTLSTDPFPHPHPCMLFFITTTSGLPLCPEWSSELAAFTLPLRSNAQWYPFPFCVTGQSCSGVQGILPSSHSLLRKDSERLNCQITCKCKRHLSVGYREGFTHGLERAVHHVQPGVYLSS